MRLDDFLREAGTEAKLMAREAHRIPITSGSSPSGGWWRGLAVAGSLAVLVWAMFAGWGAEQAPVADPIQPEETLVEPFDSTAPFDVAVAWVTAVLNEDYDTSDPLAYGTSGETEWMAGRARNELAGFDVAYLWWLNEEADLPHVCIVFENEVERFDGALVLRSWEFGYRVWEIRNVTEVCNAAVPTNAVRILRDGAIAPIETTQDWEVIGGWAELPSAPRASLGYSAIWTGDEVIFWGGRDDLRGVGTSENSGVAFDPNEGTWRFLAEAPFTKQTWHSAAWTGSEMLVWAGQHTLNGEDSRAGAYDPVTDEWRLISPAPTGFRWGGQDARWTGTELIVWGLATDDSPIGAAYDPTANSWRRIAHVPIGDRDWHSVVWTGSELIVWGGLTRFEFGSDQVPLADGSAYDPTTDTWRSIAPGPLVGRWQHTAVWTGSEMVVWGGRADDQYWDVLNDGAAYDPVADEWHMLPPSPLEGRSLHTAVWTDQGMLIWGGSEQTGGDTFREFNTGAVFDPFTDNWSKIPPSALAGSARVLPSVWTSSELVYWGHQGDDLAKTGGEVFRFPTETTQPGAVPNVLGLRLGEAIEVLERAGFPASAIEFDPQEPDALVVAQEPGGLELVPAGSLVGLRTATARVLSCPGVEGSDLRTGVGSDDRLQMGPLTFLTMGRLDDDSLFGTPDVNGRIPATKEVIQIENGKGPVWLVVRSDATRRRPSLLFGSYPGGPYLPSQGVQALQIPDCGGSAYSSFVGGYLIDHPQCIRFVIYDENFAALRSHLTGVGVSCGAGDAMVDLPNDWYRAAESLTPVVGMEILAVGTFPLREGAHKCAQNPDQALLDLGPTDVFIGLYLRWGASEGTPWPDEWGDDVMPRSIGSTIAAECVERPELDARWRSFDYGDHLIYVLIAFGDDVAEQEMKETWEILNSFSLDG